MSNFHPLFVPTELPLPLREQALKYAQSKTFSKVGAGDGSTDKSKKLIQYGVVYMKSLRFKEMSTTRPDMLPFIPGIIPGVRSASPVRQFPDADKGFRLMPMPAAAAAVGTGAAAHFPYMRRFVPSQATQRGGPDIDAGFPESDAEHDAYRCDHDRQAFATPPYAFGVPFRYPFSAYL